MNFVCLVVAGIVRATLPGPEFTLAWTHSVEKTRWEETYRLAEDRLVLVEARVEGSGAGMEAPPGAQLHDGHWVWQPQTTHAEIRLARSTYTRDYTLCANGSCAEMGALLGTPADGEIVSVRSCNGAASAGSEQVRR